MIASRSDGLEVSKSNCHSLLSPRLIQQPMQSNATGGKMELLWNCSISPVPYSSVLSGFSFPSTNIQQFCSFSDTFRLHNVSSNKANWSLSVWQGSIGSIVLLTETYRLVCVCEISAAARTGDIRYWTEAPLLAGIWSTSAGNYEAKRTARWSIRCDKKIFMVTRFKAGIGQ